ncbi:MAG: TIGR03862 family flavoprotein [Bacteroidia bacterium]|nr:TIGR03862 family flavoprotein [Bacteroidia bacterium]
MKKTIAIIGSGPAALILAAQLNEQLYDVHIYERNFAVARKFLVAGDGGFNLTHSEDPAQFIQRYTPSQFLHSAFSNFNNENLRKWLKSIGIETYVGTSKRVFPVKGIKPIDVLNAILNVLKTKNVHIHTQHCWKGWNEKNELIFEHNEQTVFVNPDVTVFSLGGASWNKTGSDGAWTPIFQSKGIQVNPFYASNCAYQVNWKTEFIQQHHGASLKNISITCAGKSKLGEVVLTNFGMEGGAIYALSPQIREQLLAKGSAEVFIDLKPSMTVDNILDRFSERGNRSITKLLVDKLHLNEVYIALLKAQLSKEEFTNIPLLAEKIKSIPVTLQAAAPMDEAISTVGGVDLSELDESFQLKKMPSVYCIGEMLDYDAPTGGYLLQSCFSMGNEVARLIS